MDTYTASSAAAAAAAAAVYSPYMVHHHSPPPLNPNPASIKADTTVAAFQSALALSTPMNVNVSMNFNSHNIQYSTGYNLPSTASSSNIPYDSFYGANRHSIPSNYPHAHHNSMSSEMKHRTDLVTAKQAMLLSAAAATSYDYKEISKLCDYFPTPASSSSASTSTGAGEKRKYA
jgi:hypothetical protein